MPLAQAIVEIDQDLKGAIINVGTIVGGAAANLVPDYAESLINVRADQQMEQEQLEKSIREIALKHHLEFICKSKRHPKPFDEQTEKLFTFLQETAHSLNISISWKESGGVSDGNTLGSCGLPTIDTMGVIGGKLHTKEEYLLIDSLTLGYHLCLHFLEQLAKNKLFLRRNR